VIEAVNSASINSTILTAAFSVAVGGTAGVGASIGVSIAENSIGYTSSGIYRPAEVQAYLKNSSVAAEGDIDIESTSTQSIEALVLAGSVAASGGGVAGVSLAGAGASAKNNIATIVAAYIDGTDPAGAGPAGVLADSISLKAHDDSTIDATVGSAALAAAFGTVGVALSVGVATARNEIRNTVASYIRNADSAGEMVKTRFGGDIRIEAIEEADIHAVSVAASAAIGAGFVGVALSGAGAEAKNVILTTTNAYVDNSVIAGGRDVVVSASDTSLIDARIASLSAAIGGGAVGVGVAIGVSVAENLIGFTLAAYCFA